MLDRVLVTILVTGFDRSRSVHSIKAHLAGTMIRNIEVIPKNPLTVSVLATGSISQLKMLIIFLYQMRGFKVLNVF